MKDSSEVIQLPLKLRATKRPENIKTKSKKEERKLRDEVELPTGIGQLDRKGLTSFAQKKTGNS